MHAKVEGLHRFLSLSLPPHLLVIYWLDKNRNEEIGKNVCTENKAWKGASKRKGRGGNKTRYSSANLTMWEVIKSLQDCRIAQWKMAKCIHVKFTKVQTTLLTHNGNLWWHLSNIYIYIWIYSLRLGHKVWEEAAVTTKLRDCCL